MAKAPGSSALVPQTFSVLPHEPCELHSVPGTQLCKHVFNLHEVLEPG